MALWCDLRVAGEGATFGCFDDGSACRSSTASTEIRRISVWLVRAPLSRTAPSDFPGWSAPGARWRRSTGREVDAGTAKARGLVNRLVDDGGALDAPVELAELLASFPQETVRTDRAAVYDGVGTALDRGLAVEGWHGSRALDTAIEGAERFAGGEGVERPDG
jgi:enoyl-CoA hydratase